MFTRFIQFPVKNELGSISEVDVGGHLLFISVIVTI